MKTCRKRRNSARFPLPDRQVLAIWWTLWLITVSALYLATAIDVRRRGLAVELAPLAVRHLIGWAPWALLAPLLFTWARLPAERGWRALLRLQLRLVGLALLAAAILLSYLIATTHWLYGMTALDLVRRASATYFAADLAVLATVLAAGRLAAGRLAAPSPPTPVLREPAGDRAESPQSSGSSPDTPTPGPEISASQLRAVEIQEAVELGEVANGRVGSSRSRQALRSSATANPSPTTPVSGDSVPAESVPAASSPPASSSAASFTVRSSGRIDCVPVRDLVAVSAEGNYVALISEQRQILHRATLSSVEDVLAAEGFLRVHRSHLIRPSSVQRLVRRGEGGEAQLGNGKLVPVSRRYRGQLEAAIEASTVSS